MNDRSDLIDLGEVVRMLARGWRWVVGGILVGTVLAVLIVLVIPPRYQSTTTVLLRSGPEDAGSSLGAAARNAQSSGLSLGGLASVLSLASGFETEIEILTSRTVVEAVVDSLGLQAEVRHPRGVSLPALFTSMSWDPTPPHRARYRFERTEGGYRVSGPRISGVAVPGVPFTVEGSTFVLRPEELPPDFEIRLFGRDEAVERASKRLRASRAGGDIAELKFRGADRRTVADVANAVIDRYLVRRQTTDRGVNQRRYEFLQLHTDSIRVELGRAEQTLRAEQERSGVFDPELFGQAELEQGLALRAQAETTEVEARALRQLLQQAAAGALSARDLAAYPTFLQNPAINNLLARLTHLEAERTQLLDRRTEQDEDVRLTERQIAQVEDQLVAVSRGYLDGLDRRLTQLRTEVGRYGAVLATLPAHAEANYRAQREVRRLSETLVALESELVQARLAAMAEGGDVRQIDRAIPPRRPAFPRPALTLALGLVVGLVGGMGGALARGYLGSRVREGFQAQLAAGVPVVEFDPSAPLLLRQGGDSRVVLLLPVGHGASTGAVARRLAATASLRDARVVLVDLESARGARPESDGAGGVDGGAVTKRSTPDDGSTVSTALTRVDRPDGGGYFLYRASANGGGSVAPRTAVHELANRFELVVVALPGLRTPAAAALIGEGSSAVLVARAGRTRRDELTESVATLDRMGASTVGVVLRRDDADGDERA